MRADARPGGQSPPTALSSLPTNWQRPPAWTRARAKFIFVSTTDISCGLCPLEEQRLAEFEREQRLQTGCGPAPRRQTILEGVLEDLETHTALRDAFATLMGER